MPSTFLPVLKHMHANLGFYHRPGQSVLFFPAILFPDIENNSPSIAFHAVSSYALLLIEYTWLLHVAN
jgi:hypothetical protein